MLIQWYPGHMHKASKEIKQTLPQVDIVIEILDARIPFSSQNPMLSTLRGDKPCIKILSKSDLADPEITRQWQTYLEQEQGVKTLAVTIEHPEKIRQLPDLCHKMLPDKAARFQADKHPDHGHTQCREIHTHQYTGGQNDCQDRQ